LQQLLNLLQKFEVVLHDTEVIIADSSDNEFSGTGTFQYFRIPNRGPSYARNFAVKKAKGEWVSFCDADDFINPYAIKYLAQLADSSTHAVFFDFKRADDAHIIESSEKHYASFQFPTRLHEGYIKGPFHFLQAFFPVHAVIVRRSVFAQIQFYEPQWFIEDVRFWLELSLQPDVNLRYYKDEVFHSFHRDFAVKQSLSTSNDELYWKSVCHNYDYLITRTSVNLSGKLLLVRLIILNYHIVGESMKPVLAAENLQIWKYFLGLPFLFRNRFLFKVLLRMQKLLR
jgi:glycosyltransferase involved in cell wall biosynthesis